MMTSDDPFGTTSLSTTERRAVGSSRAAEAQHLQPRSADIYRPAPAALKLSNAPPNASKKPIYRGHVSRNPLCFRAADVIMHGRHRAIAACEIRLAEIFSQRPALGSGKLSSFIARAPASLPSERCQLETTALF